MSEPHRSCRERLVAVQDACLIGDPRARVLLGKQHVIQRALLALRHLAVRRMHVAERERLCGARGLAGSHRLFRHAIAVGCDARLCDALDTEGALFHHTASAHRHVGIARDRRPLFQLCIGVVVEASYFVRTIVGTEPRADTAVVDHQVQAFLVVHGGAHWTHDLARRLLAVHAQNRLQQHGGCILGSGELPVDAQPMHLPLTQHLSLPTTGMLFSAWQATTQALQPMHAFRSMLMPQATGPPGSRVYSAPPSASPFRKSGCAANAANVPWRMMSAGTASSWS